MRSEGNSGNDQNLEFVQNLDMKLPKGFGGGGLGDLMKQAQEAMEQAKRMEEELAAAEVEAERGGVKVVFSGTAELKSIKLDPALVDPEDVEMLEDLIVSACREGFAKANELRENRMKAISANLPNIPGLT
jgi:DNA-binding YbaB/EbfC family protein